MEGARMFFTVSPLRAWNPWLCWSNRNQENFVIWQFECDDKVNGHVSKRWNHIECIESLSILPHGERVQPRPFIAVPQKVAPITSIWEKKSLRCVTSEVAVIPPRKERTVLSLRANHRGTLPSLAFPLKDYLSNIPHVSSTETTISAKTSGPRNSRVRLKIHTLKS